MPPYAREITANTKAEGHGLLTEGDVYCSSSNRRSPCGVLAQPLFHAKADSGNADKPLHCTSPRGATNGRSPSDARGCDHRYTMTLERTPQGEPLHDHSNNGPPEELETLRATRLHPGHDLSRRDVTNRRRYRIGETSQAWLER